MVGAKKRSAAQAQAPVRVNVSAGGLAAAKLAATAAAGGDSAAAEPESDPTALQAGTGREEEGGATHSPTVEQQEQRAAALHAAGEAAQEQASLAGQSAADEQPEQARKRDGDMPEGEVEGEQQADAAKQAGSGAEQQEEQAAGGGEEAAGAAEQQPPLLLPVPKVALLFLTRGPMPYGRVWGEWLREAEGVLPVHTLARLGCGEQQVQLVRSSTAAGSSPGTGAAAATTSYQRQHLYSVYVHAPLTYRTPYSNDSMFQGRKNKQRIHTRWGTHSLVTAVRLLLREALQDPLNQRFMLLSETGVPLWPAGLLYLQVMAEPLSRVSACAPRSQEAQQKLDLRQADLLGFPHDQWRKSSQWFVLNRRHAQMYVDDRDIDARFKDECFVQRDTVTWKARPDDRWCVSDEHYLSVLLASLGEEVACACSVGGLGTPTYAKWSSAPHPKTFTAAEMGAAAIQEARFCPADAAEAALSAFGSQLVRPEHWTQQACRAAAAAGGAGSAAGATAAATGAAATAAAAASVDLLAAIAVVGGNSSSSRSVVAATAAAAAVGEDADSYVGLLPPYRCYLALRKADPGAAEPLLGMMKQGLLHSRHHNDQRS